LFCERNALRLQPWKQWARSVEMSVKRTTVNERRVSGLESLGAASTLYHARRFLSVQIKARLMG